MMNHLCTLLLMFTVLGLSGCGLKGVGSESLTNTSAQTDSNSLSCQSVQNTFQNAIECAGSVNYQCNYVGIQRGSQTIYCYQRTGQVIPRTTPPTTCAQSGWTVSAWGACTLVSSSVNDPIMGTRTRTVQCTNSACCTNETRPQERQNCNPLLYGNHHTTKDCTDYADEGVRQYSFGAPPLAVSQSGVVRRVAIGGKLELICQMPVGLAQTNTHLSDVVAPETATRQYDCPTGWRRPGNHRFTTTLPRHMKDKQSYYGVAADVYTGYHTFFSNTARESLRVCRWRNLFGCGSHETQNSYLETIGCI